MLLQSMAGTKAIGNMLKFVSWMYFQIRKYQFTYFCFLLSGKLLTGRKFLLSGIVLRMLFLHFLSQLLQTEMFLSMLIFHAYLRLLVHSFPINVTCSELQFFISISFFLVSTSYAKTWWMFPWLLHDKSITL